MVTIDMAKLKADRDAKTLASFTKAIEQAAVNAQNEVDSADNNAAAAQARLDQLIKDAALVSTPADFKTFEESPSGQRFRAYNGCGWLGQLISENDQDYLG